jgi:hypothetical protein
MRGCALVRLDPASFFQVGYTSKGAMNHQGVVLFFAVSILATTTALPDCPVTVPTNSPVDLPAPSNMGWYGSDALAVLIRSDGSWTSKDRGRKYHDKFWLWRRGYDATTELTPDLVIAGVKLDDDELAESIHIDNATNASNGKDKASYRMLVGMKFPSAGCWKLTARYKHVDIMHDLTFVLKVED